MVSISELGRKKAHVQEGMSVLGNLEVEYVIYAHVWTHSHSHTCRRQSIMLGVFLYFSTSSTAVSEIGSTIEREAHHSG